MRAARQVIRLGIAIAIACLFLSWNGEDWTGDAMSSSQSHCTIEVHLKSDPPGYFHC